MNNSAKHKEKIERISALIKKYRESNEKRTLRFYHGSSNSTRPKDIQENFIVDISSLNEVVEVNIEDKYVLVEPNVSMELLVSTTLKHGLIPQVVMEFPAITCGGAVNGASLESSSFKYGQLSDTCEQYEVILGSGEIISATANHNEDLFYGISGSYGSLGLVSLIKIKLIESAKYVQTTYYPTASFEETLVLLREKTKDNDIDYVEGIVFSSTHGVIITGKRINEEASSPRTFSKIMDPWFYERAQKVVNQKQEELIPIVDYFFRYNRGAFWMGEFAFPLLGIPNNKLTRFLFNGYAKTNKLFEALQTLNVSQNYFLQDLFFPFDEALGCLQYNAQTLGIYPLWLCPIRSTETAQKLSPHYLNSEMLVDIGIWGQTDNYLADQIKANKEFEAYTKQHNGRKMLYAHAYYSQNEFWDIYDKDWYDKLREKYQASDMFPDVWQKTHISGRIIGSRWFGFFKFFIVNPIKKQLRSVVKA